MKEKLIFIADDGKQFEYEDECREYEQEINYSRFKEDILFFDEDGKRLPISGEVMKEAYFIKCKTIEAAMFARDEFIDWENPWGRDAASIGCWYYNGSDWISADEYLKQAAILEKILEM